MNQARRCLNSAILLAGLALPFLGAASPAAGQDPAQRLIQQVTGQNLTPDQILERLRSSGVSREQARTRLRQAGYDPSIVDPYYDRLEGGRGDLPDANGSFLSALSDIGILQAGPEVGSGMPYTVEPGAAEDTLPEPFEMAPQVFGLDLFRRATDQFEPVTSGPVDPDYRLGPGDQIVLILTGDVELAYTLGVTREGFIVIPDVGQVSVNGLTLEGLRGRLYDRLGRVYSGVRRGADASTRFDVSLGRLRTNQVFVIGDVARPGAYQISSVGTVLNALYRGGGPTESGSFRAITVNRGGRVVATVDLYGYLLRGDASADIRLEQGDIVFVPPVGSQVTLQGEVRRPAIYEVSAGESLREAVRFAGGFRPEAYIQRVQVDRILPPGVREPGRDRVLLDADVLALQAGSGPTFPVEPGDVVTVFGVLERRESRVTLEGEVWRPGEYEFSSGMTLWDLIDQASGLFPAAYLPAAHITRLIPESGATRLVRVSLETDPQGQPVEDVPLEDFDVVHVFSVDRLRTADSVRIFGMVKEPGTYGLDEGATVEDLILKAEGFVTGALAYEAEVVRLDPGYAWSDKVGTRLRVRVEGDIPHPLGAEVYDQAPDISAYDGVASQFELEDGDQVFVRRLPGYLPPVHASVSGEVLSPGTFGFEMRQERLSGLVERAGGLTSHAYPQGARLVRDSIAVGIDLAAALNRPGGEDDVFVEPGDQLVVPRYDPTVLVTGAVAFQSRVLYGDGGGVKHFLAEAGGALADADMSRLSVQYPSGARAVTRKILFFKDFPDVEPGSTIYVPQKVEGSGTNWDQLFTRTLSITTSLLTILVAVDRLGN